MEINWISLVLAPLIPMIVGFGYYSKALFGNACMAFIRKTEEELQFCNLAKTMAIAFVMALLIAFFMINFCNGAGQEGEFDSFAHGAIITIFFVMPIIVTKGLFEQNRWTNMFITVGYWLVTLALMGGIIDAST